MRTSLKSFVAQVFVAAQLVIVLPVAAEDWESLSPSEQKVLAPFAQDWDAMAIDQQQRLIDGAGLWTSMSAEEKALAHRRFSQWQRYGASQRQRILERFARFQALPPLQQRLLRQNFVRFNALSDAQKRRIRSRWQAMTPQQRATALQRMKQRQAAQGSAGTSRPKPVREPMPPSQARWFRELSDQLSAPARQQLAQRLRNASASQRNALERQLANLSKPERESFLLGTSSSN
ncbi:MAG: DUF3106 domain-containing protein [Lysobacterales bacterium]